MPGKLVLIAMTNVSGPRKKSSSNGQTVNEEEYFHCRCTLAVASPSSIHLQSNIISNLVFKSRILSKSYV